MISRPSREAGIEHKSCVDPGASVLPFTNATAGSIAIQHQSTLCMCEVFERIKLKHPLQRIVLR